MKLAVFSVMDKAVGAYLQPFFCRTKAEAIRSFAEACNDEKSNFNKYASDYYLVYCGEWDDSTGLYSGHEPVRVIAAHECLNEELPVPAKSAVCRCAPLPEPPNDDCPIHGLRSRRMPM